MRVHVWHMFHISRKCCSVMSERRGKKFNAIKKQKKKQSAVAKKQEKCSHFVPREATFV